MTIIEKFAADTQKIKKMDRQEHQNQSDYNRFSAKIAIDFERTSLVQKSLANAVFDYWEKEYILSSSDFAEEPTDKNIEKLAAFLAFLNSTDEFEAVISDTDWQNLAELVNYEAEDMDIEKLTSLMSILVSKRAI